MESSRQRLRDYFWVLFLPLSFLWAIAHQIRRKLKWGRGMQSKLPVVSVGNLESGGTGKTPLVIELCKRLADYHPIVVSRGYGGLRVKKGGRVQGSADPREFGDEPVLIANATGCPVYVGQDRRHSIREIEREATSCGEKPVIVLDDGFQHLAVNRDFDLVILSGDRDPKSSFCLPLGEYRESFSALRCATAVLISEGGFRQQWEAWLGEKFPELPSYALAKRAPVVCRVGTDTPVGRLGPIGAFCGLGNPHKFLIDASRSQSISTFRVFPDHHRYNSSDIQDLVAEARELRLVGWVTTEKDMTKVVRLMESQDVPFYVLKMGLQLDEALISAIKSQIEDRRS